MLTGRATEGRDVLQTFAHHIRDGLIPNLFPEAKTEGLYHTADATLWFFHALHRYEEAAGRARDPSVPAPPAGRGGPEALRRHAVRDRRRRQRRPLAPGRRRLPAHLDGRQGGRLGGDAAAREGGRDQRALLQCASPAGGMAEGGGGRRLGTGPRRSACAPPTSRRAPIACDRRFNRRFWNAASNCLYDVVDAQDGAHAGGDDPSVRPNQLLAISLPAPGPRARALAARARASCASSW